MTVDRHNVDGLLAAALTVWFALVASQIAPANAQDRGAATARRPDVGTVQGRVVYGDGHDAASLPDAGSDVWVFAGKREFPLDCAIFPSPRELTMGQCGTRNLSVPFLKHTTADGSGRFAVPDLPPGEYTLVIRSNHRRGIEKRDEGNKTLVSWFSIKGGDTVDATTKF